MGLLIIAIGAFCQSVAMPINASRNWARVVLDCTKVFFLGWFFRSWARCWRWYLPAIRCSRLCKQSCGCAFGLCSSELYGEWGTTFGLSMRYLGVITLERSIALGTYCRIGANNDSVFTGRQEIDNISCVLVYMVTLVGQVIGLAVAVCQHFDERKKKRPSSFQFY